MLCMLAMRTKGRKIGSRRDWEVHEMDIKGIARILKGALEMQANARSDEGNRRRKRKQIVEIMENEEKLRNEGN